MTAPHIRDLNINGWHEVPEGATIPAQTRYFCAFPNGRWFVETDIADRPPAYRSSKARYFTADPIPDSLDRQAARE